MIASRSSPWTRSRFLTKNRSSRPRRRTRRAPAGSARQRCAQRFLDPVSVLDAHRDDAEATRSGRVSACSRISSTTRSTSGDRRCSGRRRPARARRARERGTRSPLRRGTSSATVVDVGVRERDQPLVVAAVVPHQHPRGDERASSASRIDSKPVVRPRARGRLLFVSSSSSGVSTRQRSWSAAAASRRRRRRAAGRAGSPGSRRLGDLAASSKMTTSKSDPVARQQLADDERAHRPARLQRADDVRYCFEQLAHWLVSDLASGLLLHEGRLVDELVAGSGRALRDRPLDTGRSRLDMSVVSLAVGGDRLQMHLPIKGADLRILGSDPVVDRGVPGVVERPAQRARFQVHDQKRPQENDRDRDHSSATRSR